MDDLVSCIRRLLSDSILSEKISSNAAKYIRINYDWDITGNFLLNKFRNLDYHIFPTYILLLISTKRSN